MSEQIERGDLVHLKSGGPVMTVIKPVGGNWYCSWFDGSENKGASFPPEALVKAQAGGAPPVPYLV